MASADVVVSGVFDLSGLFDTVGKPTPCTAIRALVETVALNH